MDENRQKAIADFRRIAVLIVIAAVLMVIGALIYLAATGELTLHMVIATILGASLSVLIGGGLMAATFFSDKSGHDQSISDATRRRDE